MRSAQTYLASLNSRSPTITGVYGRGQSLEATHGCRRNLNITGLDALDLRTPKADGTAWKFDLAPGRQEARKLILPKKPNFSPGLHHAQPSRSSMCNLPEDPLSRKGASYAGRKSAPPSRDGGHVSTAARGWPQLSPQPPRWGTPVARSIAS